MVNSMINAVSTGDTEQIEKIISEYPNILNEELPIGDWLMYACIHDNLDSVNCLLKHGMDPNKKTEDSSPICCAAENGNIEMMKCLIEYGANPLEYDKDRCPFLAAIDGDYLDVVILLLEKGFDISHIYAFSDRDSSAYEYAMDYASQDILEYLSNKKNCVKESNIYPTSDKKIYRNKIVEMYESREIKSFLSESILLDLCQKAIIDSINELIEISDSELYGISFELTNTVLKKYVNENVLLTHYLNKNTLDNISEEEKFYTESWECLENHSEAVLRLKHYLDETIIPEIMLDDNFDAEIIEWLKKEARRINDIKKEENYIIRKIVAKAIGDLQADYLKSINQLNHVIIIPFDDEETLDIAEIKDEFDLMNNRHSAVFMEYLDFIQANK